MGIRFDCISCKKTIAVHDRMAGRQIECPRCEFKLKVPTLQEVRAQQLATTASSSNDDLVEPLSDEDDIQAELVPSAPKATRLGKESEPIPSLEDYAEEEPASHRRSLRHEHEGHEEEDVEWDITPMVDVAFLLLIFFMLTASFSVQKAIPTTPPKEDKPSSNAVPKETPVPTDSFAIQIDEFNAYTIVTNDGLTMDASSKQELITHLNDLKSQFGDSMPKIFVQAHSMSIHGAVVACIDAARESGFTTFQVEAVDEFN